MKLYTYYRSQASFRVRIALNLKGIAREDSFLHLEKGDQFVGAYRAINPHCEEWHVLLDQAEAQWKDFLFGWHDGGAHIRRDGGRFLTRRG
jgi:hypothetical protein